MEGAGDASHEASMHRNDSARRGGFMLDGSSDDRDRAEVGMPLPAPFYQHVPLPPLFHFMRLIKVIHDGMAKRVIQKKVYGLKLQKM